MEIFNCLSKKLQNELEYPQLMPHNFNGIFMNASGLWWSETATILHMWESSKYHYWWQRHRFMVMTRARISMT
jgi:hypothetical protein